MAHDKKEMISFYVTTDCNLDCIYCYTNKKEGEHSHQTLDYEFAKAGIDDYYKSNYKKHIRFFGAGEPTTRIELIKKIYDYAKTKDESTISEIQSNGCFSESVAEWLGKHIDIIWISSDGMPKDQNYYRPFLGGGESSAVLERNLKYLITYGKGTTGIRTTVTMNNVTKQIENIQYFETLGIKNFWVDPIFPVVGEEDPIEKIDMDLFVEEFVKAVKYAYSHGMTYGSILTCNFDEPGEYACRALLPVPHLTTDGYVSACDMALFGNDNNHMNVFIYGKWNPEKGKIEYDQKKIEFLQSRKLSNLKKCSNCEVGEYCRGYCPGEVTNETKNLFGCKNQICEPTKKIFKILNEEQKKYIYSHP